MTMNVKNGCHRTKELKNVRVPFILSLGIMTLTAGFSCCISKRTPQPAIFTKPRSKRTTSI